MREKSDSAWDGCKNFLKMIEYFKKLVRAGRYNMVYTVTLNPALDLFLSPQSFAPGRDQRYQEGVFLPGGKGINVSLLLGSLGVETTALGLAAGFTGRALADMLERRRCRTDFCFLSQGLTRVNVKITPPDQKETALNGGGPAVAQEDLEHLGEKLSLLKEGDFLVLAGSVPQSVPSGVYAWLMEQTPAGVRVVVDATGPALRAAMGARPFLVKPNLEELAELFGVERVAEDQAPGYAKKLQDMGAANVLVSMGGQGALLLTEDKALLRRPALPGREVSAVGAGDSMVAGFLYGLLRQEGAAGALAWGMAAGAATAFRQGIATGEEVRALMERAPGPFLDKM